MTTLTDKFTALEGQINDDADEAHSQRASIETTLEDIQTTLSSIDSDMLLMKSALISAISNSGTCSVCPTTPLIGTPPTTGAIPTTSDFCKRIQAFLTFISLCCDYADAVGDISSAFSTGFVTSIIGEIRTTMSDSGIPVPGWIDTVAIAAAGVNYVVSRAILGGSTHELFDPIRDTIQGDMFTAGTVMAASAAFSSDIDAASGLAAAKPLIKSFAYGDVVNYFLDDGSSPNLTPYSGTGCFPADCVTFTSDSFDELFVDNSYLGWTVLGEADACGIDLWTSNVTRANRWTSGPIDLGLLPSTANNPPFFQNHGPGYYFGRALCGGSFSLTFCPPAE